MCHSKVCIIIIVCPLLCIDIYAIVSASFSGWVNELVGGQHSGAKGFMFFGVNVDLTEDGIGIIVNVVICMLITLPYLTIRGRRFIV